MKKKTKIIIGILVLVIVIAAIAISAILLTSNSEKKTSTKDLEWGDVYLALLEDEDNFSDIENIEIQLCDIDNNNIPELVLFGISDNINVVRIYNIDSNKANMSTNLEMEYSSYLELLYNTKKGGYDWYLVTDDEDVYEFTLGGVVKKLTYSYDNFETVIDENSNPRFEFEASASNSTIKKVFENAKEMYIPIKEILSGDQELLRQSKTESGEFEIEISTVKDTLKSEYEHLVLDWTHYEVTVKNDKDPELAEKIESFLNEETADYNEKDFQEYLDSFQDTEDSTYSDKYEMKQTLEIMLQTEKLLSVKYELAGSFGGVPWETTLGYVIDLETGDEYSLNDITADYSKFESVIISQAKTQLQKEIGLSALDSNYESTLKEQFKTYGHWYFTDEGIEFTIEKYSIGAGVLGAPTIIVSYDDIKDQLTDDILDALEIENGNDENNNKDLKNNNKDLKNNNTNASSVHDSTVEKNIKEFAESLTSDSWYKETSPNDLTYFGYEDGNLIIEIATSPSGNVYYGDSNENVGLVTCLDGSDTRYSAVMDITDLDSMWMEKGSIGICKNDEYSIFYYNGYTNGEDQFTRYHFETDSNGNIIFEEKAQITGFNNLVFKGTVIKYN